MTENTDRKQRNVQNTADAKNKVHFAKSFHQSHLFLQNHSVKFPLEGTRRRPKQKKKGVSACKSALSRSLATGKPENACSTRSGSMKLVKTRKKESTLHSAEIPLFAQNVSTQAVKLIFHHRYSLHSTLCSQTKPKT